MVNHWVDTLELMSQKYIYLYSNRIVLHVRVRLQVRISRLLGAILQEQQTYVLAF